MSEVRPTGRPNARLRQTVGDMLRSLAVVLAVVFAILIVTHRPQPDPVRVVDTVPAITLATVQAAFPVEAPHGLPGTWRATSARWEPTPKSVDEPVLHLGYVTPEGEYAQFSASLATGASYLAEQTGGGHGVGTTTIDGVTWQTWSGADRHSLVRDADGVTTVVSGGADWPELEALARSLAPVPSATPAPTPAPA